MLKKLFYAFLMGVFLCGCSSDELEQPAVGSLVGSVSDRTTGEPISVAGVELQPGGHTTVTGSDGSFNYPELEPGTYTVHISKEGYMNADGEFVVKAGQSTSAHLLIERLPATITPDRDVLDFGSNVGLNMLSFAIVNTNYTALEYTIEYDCEWIKEVKPARGALASGKTETIVVNIDRTTLNEGINETILVVKTSNGRAEIKITVTGVGMSLPKLNVSAATDIDVIEGTAVLHGSLDDMGNPPATEQGFVYGLLSSPTIDDNKIISPRTVRGAYSEKVSNLPLDKTIYVRAYAKNEKGIAYSEKSIEFSTNAILPQVQILEPMDIDIVNGTATLVGQIVKSGTPAYTERGFVYSALHDPTVNDNKIVANGSGIGRFSFSVMGLPLDKTIYVRAYAINRKGIAYSEESMEISTNAIPPQVSTLDPVDVDFSNGSATLVGQIVKSGSPAYTERGFVYSTMHDPTVNDNKIVANGSGTGRFSLYTTGLPTGKPVYIRAYATSERAGTVYGEEVVIQPEWIELKSAGIAVQTKDLGYANWGTSKSMCENSIVGGYTDWRLPTKEELMILYNNKDIIGGFEKDSYWSSSIPSGFNYASSYRYYIDFYNGEIDSEYMPSNYNHYVRAVRTLTNN